MKAPHIASNKALSRRHFLRGTGASLLSLPLLDAMIPAFAQGADTAGNPPQRFVAVCATLGFHRPFLFPEKTGSDYELTPYLKKLKKHRDDFTVLSGLSHPSQQGNNGHASEMTWLTSAQRPGLAGFKNSISLDQLIAGKIGVQTRYPYLALSTRGRSLSWTSSGVEIPSEVSPEKLFKALFIEGSKQEVAAELSELNRGRSILDTVLGEAKKLEKDLGSRDREKLEEYLTSVRDLEIRLQQSEEWSQKPKPKISSEQPKDIQDRNDSLAKQRLLNEMMVLALQTDSTRTATFLINGMNAIPSNIPGVNTDWHNLSHHGKDPAKIDELKIIEESEFTVLDELLSKLKNVEEAEGNLLDHTTILYGSNLGNASSHSTKNLPVIVAGGGYRHGQHLSLKNGEGGDTPLANLYVSIAQRMGLEIDAFGSSNKAGVVGLELI